MRFVYYSYKVKDPNKGRRKPFRHWMMKLLPVLIIVLVIGTVVINGMFEMGRHEEDSMVDIFNEMLETDGFEEESMPYGNEYEDMSYGNEYEDMSYGSEYEGFIIVDTFVLYEDAREQNAYFLVLENPNTYESEIIEVSESQLLEYNVGEEFHSYIE